MLSLNFPTRHLTSLVFPRVCLGCDAEIEPEPESPCGWSLQSEHETQHPSGSTALSRVPAATTNNGHSILSSEFKTWQRDHWCLDCLAQLRRRPDLHCPKCGAWMDVNPLGDRCRLCFRFKIHIDRAFAVGNYQSLVQELVIRMKNQHDETLAWQLGQYLGYELLSRQWTDFDMLVPVPAHWWRKFRRGFLAAHIIGESVSQLTGIPDSTAPLRAVRSTRKQGTLSITGRFANVRNAFAVSPKAEVSGSRILLIDDVLTSGATTSELARILKRAGAAEVSAAVIARGTRVG